MAEQLRGPYRKFVDSTYSKKRPLPRLHKVPTPSSEVAKKGCFKTTVT
jgi:hypothetical protein